MGVGSDDAKNRFRVRLFMLNVDRQWSDHGTGHVTSSYVDNLNAVSLTLRSEENGAILLESKIDPQIAYQKQMDTLIVWSEPDNYDFAMSFQEKSGCDEIWEKICQVQGRDPDTGVYRSGEAMESGDEQFDDGNELDTSLDLPTCELGRLEDIARMFNSVSMTPSLRERLAVAIEQSDYIRSLLDLFQVCEDLENTEGLHHLFEIFKSIFLLNQSSLFAILFSDEFIIDVVGVLEHDPNMAAPTPHRHFIRETAKFRQVLPFGNAELLSKIHQTYRVQYIQDVILPTPSVFEENMLSALNSFVFFNKVDIVTRIQEETELLQTLFKQLTDDDTSEDRRYDLILFLKELCLFSQTLQNPNRETFIKVLSQMDLLGAIEYILGLDDDRLKLSAIDIFSHVVEFNPSMVRDFILQESKKQDEEDLLINLVVEQMITDSDPELGGAVLLMSNIRILVDPENMLTTTNKTEKSEFLTFYYKHCMHVLTAPLFANTAGDHPSKDDYKTAQLLSLILELLTFCIEHHTYHMKTYMTNKDLLRRVLVLLKSRHAFLALGALRLMRRLIALNDDNYNRYIIRGNLFAPVVSCFLSNGEKYNLLNSAIIEMFEYILIENIQSLINNVVELHSKSFESVSYVKTFKFLKERHKANKAGSTLPYDRLKENLAWNPCRRDERTQEEEEEMWFEQDEDMGDSEPLASMNEMFKPKIDSVSTTVDYGSPTLNRFLDRKAVSKASKENDWCDSTTPPPPSQPKWNNGKISININLNNKSPSPPPLSGVLAPTPACSPSNSPASPLASPNKLTNNSVLTEKNSATSASPQLKKSGLIGLVDYDEDSEEEEDEEDSGVTSSNSTSTTPATKPGRGIGLAWGEC